MHRSRGDTRQHAAAAHATTGAALQSNSVDTRLVLELEELVAAVARHVHQHVAARVAQQPLAARHPLLVPPCNPRSTSAECACTSTHTRAARTREHAQEVLHGHVVAAVVYLDRLPVAARRNAAGTTRRAERAQQPARQRAGCAPPSQHTRRARHTHRSKPCCASLNTTAGNELRGLHACRLRCTQTRAQRPHARAQLRPPRAAARRLRPRQRSRCGSARRRGLRRGARATRHVVREHEDDVRVRDAQPLHGAVHGQRVGHVAVVEPVARSAHLLGVSGAAPWRSAGRGCSRRQRRA